MMSPEFSLIADQIAPLAGSAQNVVLGIGDDAALLSLCDDQDQVVAMDTLVAGRHFFADHSAFDVGWKALAVNLSDLASMGAVPQFALLSLSLPSNEHRISWVSEFMRGWHSLASQYGVVLVGGDTTSSPVLSISVTVIGQRPARTQRMLRQSGQVGDDLWVSGSIGSAGLGLALLLEDKAISDELAQALHRPQPRLALGKSLLPYVNAAMDISDGLLADLTHILQASGGIGAELDWQAVPMRDEVRNWANNDLLLPLVAGDDYELLFSASESVREVVLHIADITKTPVYRIGRLTVDSGLRVMMNGQALSLPSRLGFDHFDL